jgi:drug/metabolite transporter (DMT)-like permease
MMEVITDVFSAQSIPLSEIAFSRCAIMLLLSFLWLRKSGQPIFGPPNIRNLLVSRALIGNISVFTFIGSIQRLPLPQAIVLSFTTPIMASIAARFILHERLRIAEIGGLAFSFFGVLFIFRSMLTTQGLATSKESSINGIRHIYAILIGLFSSISGGVTYCLIRAAAKASDQPVVTVFSFGLLSAPAAAVYTFAFQDFVRPGLYSLFFMTVLGILAFFAEILLARGLQLEKTSKVVNIQYLEIALSQIWGMGLIRVAPSFGRVVGCILISVSAGLTFFLGPEKEIEQ